MSQLTSARATEQATAQFSDEPFIVLLTLTSDERPDPIYIARNREPVVSRGNTYVAWPFQIGLPSDSDEMPSAQITVANVSRRIGQELERMIEPPQALVELVLASTPDTVERSWDDLLLTQVSWDAFRMTGTLQQLEYWDEPYPGAFVTPADFPGLFA